MNITTKYNIAQKVWIIYYGKAVEKEVLEITIEIKPNTTQGNMHGELIFYKLNDNTGLEHSEKAVFGSKQELLESL